MFVPVSLCVSLLVRVLMSGFVSLCFGEHAFSDLWWHHHVSLCGDTVQLLLSNGVRGEKRCSPHTYFPHKCTRTHTHFFFPFSIGVGGPSCVPANQTQTSLLPPGSTTSSSILPSTRFVKNKRVNNVELKVVQDEPRQTDRQTDKLRLTVTHAAPQTYSTGLSCWRRV